MRILFLVSRIPWPLEKGDKLRAYNQLRILSQHHEVALFALHDEPVHPEAVERLSPFCQSIEFVKLSKPTIARNLFKALMNGKPFQVGYFHNFYTKVLLEKMIGEFKPDHIYCQLLRTAEYVKDIRDIPKTIDYQDAFAKGLERRIEGDPFYMKWVLKMENRRLSEYERDTFDRFEHKAIISEQDRQFIHHPKRENIIIVRNGVDFEFFAPQDKEKQYDIVFTGNMAYPPNIASVEYLVQHIMPLVWKTRPETTVLISGATPHAKVQQLQSDKVTVTGWVDDIRDSYAASRVFIAPMQISIGLQNKLLEAMAMQLPCITSEMANNALGAEKDEHILIGNTPEEYANHIFHLLSDNDRANQLAAAGHNWVKQHYSWEAMTQPLLDVFEK